MISGAIISHQHCHPCSKMLCCLNPDCPSPMNPNGNQYCQSCSAPLTQLLRGHYRVKRVLSDEGGFGRTYLAEDADKLNERCVVKQLAPKVQGTWALAKAVELFKEEAKRLQELGRHLQIPTLLAYFEQDNYLYLVQEFVDGQNLFKELQEKSTLSERDVREVLLDVLPVLQFIHEHGVIHRDIKPQNIMRRSLQSSFPRPSQPPSQGSLAGIGLVRGDLVLIDFGASKQLTATVQTKPGTTIGSFGYSPIEQINGGEAYPGSDLFSLGATCFHLLTAISPFQLWTEYGYSWVNSWRQYVKYPVSREFAEVMDKLLKKSIHDRYQSANDVLQDLILQAPNPPSNPPQRPVPHTSNSPIKSPQNRVKSGKPKSLIGKLASLKLAVQETTKLQKTMLVGGTFFLTALIGTEIYGYMRYGLFPSAPSFLISSLPSSVFLQRTLSGHSNSVMSVAISQDGKILASGSRDKTVKLWDFETGEEIRTLRGHNESITQVAFSPVRETSPQGLGKTLVSASSDRTIRLWNISTGEGIRTFRGHSDGVVGVAYSPDGKILASASNDKTIKLWNITTGEEIRTLRGHTNGVWSVAFSPDGKTLASSSGDKTIKLWDVDTGDELRTLRGHTQAVVRVAFSPDGKTLASSSNDQTIKLWNLPSGQEMRSLNGHDGAVWSVCFRFDGTMLASSGSDRTIQLWNPFRGEEIRTLKGHAGSVWSVIFSPDAKTLVSASEDATIKIWRVSP
jgi:serine/threonine protein kinase